MKTLTLYLKFTTFLLLIWMYQYFYNCDSYKTLIDKNILQIINELKYERVLTEGDIAGEKQTNAEGCQEECPTKNNEKEKKKIIWKNSRKLSNPYNLWQKFTSPALFERFKNEINGMDPKWIEEKWKNEWNQISENKVKDLSSIFQRSDISNEEKEKLILDTKTELFKLYMEFVDESKKEMRGNKTESESESEKELRDKKRESESNNEMKDHRTESESINEMIDNRTETESMKEMRENRRESKSEKEMIDNKAESESEKEMIDNKAESESEKEMRYDKTESKSRNEQGTNEVKNYKKIWVLLIVLIILRRI
ncbi:fam-g protein [Plasmodium gallinaceum]|uniref:Fam-g protein n=1 Tax=Plasmodium gallinaceum TaxID=5849 RepID=A0A1J1GUB7_PLAGA|nr:fam-g protein [Plasmodium gallinaceum]CRG96077.1 fam-g protein [Plasmodium gallinaceum]